MALLPQFLPVTRAERFGRPKEPILPSHLDWSGERPWMARKRRAHFKNMTAEQRAAWMARLGAQ